MSYNDNDGKPLVGVPVPPMQPVEPTHPHKK